jgi:hypothetical protein
VSKINIFALMMEAVSTSETSVNFYQTTRPNIPEDSYLHTGRRENLKSHKTYVEPEEDSSHPHIIFKIHFNIIFLLCHKHLENCYDDDVGGDCGLTGYSKPLNLLKPSGIYIYHFLYY